jgi:ATP-dependent exoDNAse (exonuclease V) beta subunit
MHSSLRNAHGPPHTLSLMIRAKSSLDGSPVVRMADEVFPSYQAVKKGPESREMEEERRSCFVAITRVQETLHISWAQSYNGYGKKPVAVH